MPTQKLTTNQIASTPTLCGFNPHAIPYQWEVIKFLRSTYDHTTGTPEILLSGSVGSAKSILMAHITVTHCLEHAGARVALCRKGMPDLKRTIFKEILEHIEDDLEEGKDYKVNHSQASIRFKNGSEIISISWSDRRYKKARSLKLSGAVFEELTENDDEDREAFMTIKQRLRRIVGIKENFLIAATNPDSPSHWVYDYFIDTKKPTRKVFYSVTFDNPFLDPIYIEQLREDLDPRMARRMIYGEWIEIQEDVIYHAYNKERQFIDKQYTVDPRHPIIWTHDFNIALNKPMSSVFGQFIEGTWHWFAEITLHGGRTLSVCEEAAERGLLDYKTTYYIEGDATGQAGSSKALHSDYEIITKFLSNYKGGIAFRQRVPRSNPPIKTRHNMVNAYCLNDHGECRMYLYKGCENLDKGLRLTALKKGGQYVEDDSKEFQHATTAIGYAIVFEMRIAGRGTKTKQL